MLSQYLSAIEGVASYPIVSLMIFVPFFLIVTVWIFKLDKKYLEHMSGLPLEESHEQPESRN
jgi:cytochrome c oxidase cbb3-type subunit IV